MSLEQVSREHLQEGMIMLDQAFHNHQQWYNELTRTLICHLTPDQHDVSEDACHQCRLGQWYDRVTHAPLKTHPGFIALGKAHAEMHGVARDILINMQNGTAILPLLYDQFVNAREKLQLEIMALRSELETLLYHRDPLTGAVNRVNMLPYLREQQEIAKRLNQTTCLVMMDLDLFKEANDFHGHAAGDTALVTITQHLISNLRSYDKVFRYGGEEFLICLPSTGLDEAYRMIERVRAGIAIIKIPAKHSQVFHLTASFGIAILDTKTTVETSLEHADNALYAAKKSGRNATHIWKEPA